MTDEPLTVDEFRMLHRKQVQDATAGGRIVADEHTMTDAQFEATRRADTTEEQQ
ncbi:hypothetical protein ACH5A2_30810 [Streptomyces collinus]|uniref:hypothetical protein n=1 Tax=Streptomyces collinus TaxID=42684 RepID=UPI0037A45F0D